MQVKGTAVSNTPTYVRRVHGDAAFTAWFDSLPESSRVILKAPLATRWYPAEEAVIVPTQAICNQFFDGQSTGAIECGRFSADSNLTGVYRKMLYITDKFRMLSDRIGSLFILNYRPGKAVAKADPKTNSGTIRLLDFDEPHDMLEWRIAGFAQRAQEMQKAKAVTIERTMSMTLGDPHTEFLFTWLET